MSRIHRLLLAHAKVELQDLVARHSLSTTVETHSYAFSIFLENASDYLSITYSTHQLDYPYSLDVLYCKQALIDRSRFLYRTDTKAILSLRRYDQHANLRIANSLKEDKMLISDACARACRMFDHFAKLTVLEYKQVQEAYR